MLSVTNHELMFINKRQSVNSLFHINWLQIPYYVGLYSKVDKLIINLHANVRISLETVIVTIASMHYLFAIDV
jgi:hypothetical protein